MDKTIEIDLIKMEVLGCISEGDSKSLRIMKETEDDFPWNELAEFQNLVSLYPLILEEKFPAAQVKNNFVRKLNTSLFGEKTGFSLNEVDKENEVVDREPTKEAIQKTGIDWGSLSILEWPPDKEKTFEEIKPKKSLEKKEPVQESDPQLVKEEEEEVVSFETLDEESEIIIQKIPKTSKFSRGYIMASAFFSTIAVFVVVYLLLNQGPEIVEAKIENNPPVDTTFAISNNLNDDSLIGIVTVQNVEKISQEEPKKKQQVSKEVLTETKNSPKFPEPVEPKFIEPATDIPVKEPEIEDEAVTPPKEDITEIKEEPTYFVAVEEMPEPIGGLVEIQKRIIYPEIAKRAGIEGKVFVRAYVDETGTVTSAEVVKGIGGGCNEAALDAILKTKFNPGKQRGKPIKVQVTIPIIFKQ